MSRPVVSAAARRGHRYSHSTDFEDAAGGSLLGVVMAELLNAAGSLASLAIDVGRGLVGEKKRPGSTEKPPEDVTVRTVTSNSSSGKIEYCSEDTFFGPEKMGAALVNHEDESCAKCSDQPLLSGATGVFVNGKLVSRAGDETGCGALIFDGEPTILIGGAPTKDDPPPAKRTTEQRLESIDLGNGQALTGAMLSRILAEQGIQIAPGEWGQSHEGPPRRPPSRGDRPESDRDRDRASRDSNRDRDRDRSARDRDRDRDRSARDRDRDRDRDRSARDRDRDSRDGGRGGRKREEPNLIPAELGGLIGVLTTVAIGVVLATKL